MIFAKKILCFLMAMSLVLTTAALLVSCKEGGEAHDNTDKTNPEGKPDQLPPEKGDVVYSVVPDM